MKILIIDDQPNEVLQVLNNIAPEASTEIALTGFDGISCMRATSYDLVILDVVLPWSDGTDPSEDCGKNVLDYIYNKDQLKRPSYLIGITSEIEVYASVENTFRQHGWTLVCKQTDAWPEIIANFFSSASAETNTDSDLEIDYAIICSIRDPEHKSILKLPLQWEPLLIRNDTSTAFLGVHQPPEEPDRSFTIVLACCRHMGLTSAAVLTTKIVQLFRPRVVIAPGITGGVKGKVALGDIVVAAPSWDYGSGKITTNGDGEEVFIPATNEIPLAGWVEDRLQQFSQNWINQVKDLRSWIKISQSKVLFGPVASGVQVVAVDRIPKSLETRNRKVLAIEMETYSIYYASTNSTFSQPAFFSCKCVTDFADKDKSDVVREDASDLSALFALAVIRSGILVNDD